MDRSQLLKLMHKLNKFITLLNKYIYILPLISMLTNLSFLRNNKLVVILRNIIKFIIIISILITGVVVLYFTDFSTPINTTYSIYSDLLEPYIELIKKKLE